MSNDKQRHLVTTHVYTGVTWWPLCQSLLVIKQAGKQRVHLSDGNVTWNQKPGLRWRHECVKTSDNQSSHPRHVFRFALGGWLLNAVKLKKPREQKLHSWEGMEGNPVISPGVTQICIAFSASSYSPCSANHLKHREIRGKVKLSEQQQWDLNPHLPRKTFSLIQLLWEFSFTSQLLGRLAFPAWPQIFSFSGWHDWDKSQYLRTGRGTGKMSHSYFLLAEL